MANTGVNNVPAAGKWGAAPAMASVEGEAQSLLPSSGYNTSSKPEGFLTGTEEGDGSGVVLAPLPRCCQLKRRRRQCGPSLFGPCRSGGWIRERVSRMPYRCARADSYPMNFFAVFDGHGDPR